jgi:hypothetical protein
MLVSSREPWNFGFDRYRDSACIKAAFHCSSEIPFHGASEGAFDLESEPFRGVMASSNYDRSEGLTFDDGPAAGWGWNGCIR